MAIAGALVIPTNRDCETELAATLNNLGGVEVQEAGPKGLAVVLEAATNSELKDISKKILEMENVVDFSIGYINWEDTEER